MGELDLGEQKEKRRSVGSLCGFLAGMTQILLLILTYYCFVQEAPFFFPSVESGTESCPCFSLDI